MRKKCALIMRRRTLVLRATDNHAGLPDNSRRISRKSAPPPPPPEQRRSQWVRRGLITTMQRAN